MISKPALFNKGGINLQIMELYKNKKMHIAFSAAIFLFMMVYNLLHSAPWGDEWHEYYYSQESIKTGELYNCIIKTFQPPLYNFLMHFWLKVNQSIFWFRFFNVLVGCIAGVFLFKAIKQLYNDTVACVAIVGLAICMQWVYCIQECSEYALMLGCLCGALYFYLLCDSKFTYLRMALFIFASVLAIYSQYGAVFIALPLLFLFYVNIVFNKTEMIKRKIILTISYAASLMVFALPLYVFFLSKQLEHNGISENTVSFSGKLLQDIPFTLGTILGYFFGVNSGSIWPIILSIMSVVFLACCVILCVRKNVPWCKKSLVLVLLIGYVLHYLLVQLHIYAMVHPGQSAGFYTRYSYFYLPLLAVVLPVLILESKDFLIQGAEWKKYVAYVMVGCVASVSMFTTLENWNKALDDQFAQIWLENEGWKDVTYLYGITEGFYYYIEKADGYNDTYVNKVTTTVDNENLPECFWAWRTNRDGDGWKTTIDSAKEQGYNVTIYRDEGYSGQLAYCTLKASE